MLRISDESYERVTEILEDIICIRLIAGTTSMRMQTAGMVLMAAQILGLLWKNL